MANDQPHDSLFRLAFSHLDVAREHLRAQLPAALVARIRWETLALEDVTFVDPALNPTQADLLFSVRLRGGRRLFVYVLFEHQSKAERRMPLRMLRYVFDIHASLDEPLPEVVPLVLYTGKRPWREPVATEELLPGRFAPRFRFGLLDLGRTDDAALGGPGVRRSVLLLMKYARLRNVWQRVIRWLPEWAAWVREPGGLVLLQAMWSYLSRATRDEPPPDVFLALEVTMGVDVRQEAEGWGVRRERLAREQGLEQGLEQGREQGLEQGREQGLEEGLEQGQVGVLLAQLAAKFGPVPPEVERRVRTGSGEERARWAIRVLTAEDFDGVFTA
jgi:Putative transposase, YhgA-like